MATEVHELESNHSSTGRVPTLAHLFLSKPGLGDGSKVCISAASAACGVCKLCAVATRQDASLAVALGKQVARDWHNLKHGLQPGRDWRQNLNEGFRAYTREEEEGMVKRVVSERHACGRQSKCPQQQQLQRTRTVSFRYAC